MEIFQSGRSVTTYLPKNTDRIPSINMAFGVLDSIILTSVDCVSPGVEDMLTRVSPINDCSPALGLCPT
jgi:hypothetical protein